MVINLFKYGSGSVDPAIRYVLGGKDHAGKDRSVAPVVLHGDPQQFAALCSTIAFKQVYTSGALSFSESDIDLGKLQEIMVSFEQCLFPGLGGQNYSIIWVLHRDKERVELHFLSAEMELTTGKRLQGYYHKADLKRVDLWKKIINSEYGFTDPDQPSSKRLVASGKDKNTPQTTKAVQQQISDEVLNSVHDGKLVNRSEIVEFIDNRSDGVRVVREGSKFISISHPQFKTNIRLKGRIFERDFDASAIATDLNQADEDFRNWRKMQLPAMRKEYIRLQKERQDYLQKRYCASPLSLSNISEQHETSIVSIKTIQPSTAGDQAVSLSRVDSVEGRAQTAKTADKRVAIRSREDVETLKRFGKRIGDVAQRTEQSAGDAEANKRITGSIEGLRWVADQLRKIPLSIKSKKGLRGWYQKHFSSREEATWSQRLLTLLVTRKLGGRLASRHQKNGYDR